MGLLSLDTSVVVMWKFGINDAVTAIDRYNVTHFPLVSPMLVAFTIKAKSLGGGSLGSLRQGYGMTEFTAVGTRGFNTGMFRKYTLVGLLASNMQARVEDCRTGSFMCPGETGELWLRGPGVMGGYLNDRQATMIAINEDGWLCTGDIGYFDDQGYVHIVDRLKDIIKYKGFRIAPADLEAILLTHPDILDAAIVGAADEEAGEVPTAFLVKKPGSMLSGDAVIQYVTKQVAPYKKVRKAVFVTLIPNSAAGKILRRELRNLLSSKL
ncbi:hypothetical protein Dimus_008193 [Dionaea muscipula]